MQNSIDQISDGAAENKRERGYQTGFLLAQAPQHDDDETDGKKGNQHEEGQAKGFMAAGEDAERGTGIAHVSQAEQAIDDRNRLMQTHQPIDDGLGQLIEDDDDNQPSRDKLPLRAQAGAPESRTRAQRATRERHMECRKRLALRALYFSSRAL